jgi:hypothetical protein
MKQISDPMNTPKLPTDTPNDHDASKEDQFDLLDPGEHMVDSGEEFKDVLNVFDSVAFAKSMRKNNKISADRLMPQADMSMLWKPRDQELDDENPELQKDTITKFLPKESKVWDPGEQIIHQNPVESQDIRPLKMHIGTVLNNPII